MNKTVKKCIHVLLVVMMLCFCWKGEVQASNTSINTATSVIYDNQYSDDITSSVDARYYRLDLPSSGWIQISFSGDIGYVYCSLYEGNGERLNQEYVGRSNVTNQANYTGAYNLNAGTYYFGVSSAQTGDYTFNVTYISANESFSESGDGNNNNIQVANPIEFNTQYRGYITWTDEVDYYRVTLPSSGKLNLNIGGNIKKVTFKLYNANGDNLDTEYYARSSVTGQISENYACNLCAGTYYIAFNKYTYTGLYKFNASFTSANESFTETGKDNYTTGANVIQLDQTYNGHMTTLIEDVDYYKFVAPTTGTYMLTMNSEFDSKIYIYNTSGDKVTYGYSKWNDSLGVYELNGDITLSKGTYYFGVYSYQYAGKYTFRIDNRNKKPSQVTLSSVKSSKKKTMVVKWKKLNNVDGYQIQYATSKKFKGKNTVYVSTNLGKKTLKKLSRKKRYYVRVRAYNYVNKSYVYGKWSKIKSVKVK